MTSFALVRSGQTLVPMLVGLDGQGLLGFDPVGVDFWRFDATDVAAAVNLDPVAVFGGVELHTASSALRAVANRARRIGSLAPLGARFPPMPEGVFSGFPVAAPTIRRHRRQPPELDTIVLSLLFAVSTVRTSIGEAEKSYQCFADMYASRGRTMPEKSELVRCFRGLQNTKAETFHAMAEYAPEIETAIRAGYADRELRSILALDVGLPKGLALTKLSFVLALLGHDCVCLDARLLGTMFDAADRKKVEVAIGEKRSTGLVAEHALLVYENVESAFLAENPYYDPSDPIGRARAQWLSWEAVGQKGATHEVWLSILPRWSGEDQAG